MKEDDRSGASVANLTPHVTRTLRARGSGKQKFVLLFLLLLALMVIFLLPKFVSGPWIASDEFRTPVVANPAPSAVSPSTAAEKTKYRQDSQKLLAEIIARRDQLLGQHVESWAGTEFRQALGNIDSGDEQYGDGDYASSMSSYERGLKQLDALLQLGQEKLSKALAEGVEAIESLDVSAAIAATELANAIAPDDIGVKELTARSAALPQVKKLLESGDRALAAKQLEAARAAYQSAAESDPSHKRAVAALAAVKKDILESDFRKHMSIGYAALENRDFDKARSAFLQAGHIYNGDASVQQALALLENQQGQLEIGQQINRAAEMESREEWQQAVQIYESLLQQDPSLVEVKVKLIPARVRGKLDEQLTGIMADPLKLSDGTAYRNAKRVLSDARGISNPGEKLRGQIAAVSELLQMALSPVKVVFQSDNQTDVTVFRVARLGQFEETSLQLKPGRYIVAGTRRGFRDVRIEFTVTGTPLETPIVIRCEEPI